MTITRLTTDHVRIPFPKRGKVSLTAPAPVAGPDGVDLLIVRVDTADGLAGLGFTPVLGPGLAAVRQLLEAELFPLLVGEAPTDVDRLFAKAAHHFRAIGFCGLPARAYSAIDIALWDVKGRLAGQSLAKLLGGLRSAAPFFLSDSTGTGWDPADVAKAAKPAIRNGAMGVRVEVGGGDLNADADRVRELSEALGDDAWLGVAAGGRYDLNTALALAHFFEDQAVDWFEDPIPASDFLGYARLADRMEMPLAVGAGLDRVEDFYRVIRDGLARVVRPDIHRLGGITPTLQVAAVAGAYHVAVSPVRSHEVTAHLACGLAMVPHAEFCPWFASAFTGGPKAEGGKLVPTDRPGHGLTVTG